jgi:hypothetical protein
VAQAEAARRALNAAAAAPDLAASGLGAAPPAAAPAPAARAVVAIELTRADPAALGRALGLGSYEAEQRVRRGGWQLLRVGAPAGSEETAALLAAGARVLSLLENDVSSARQPLVALGGSRADGRLDLRTTEGRALIAPGTLLVVVRGPIARRTHVGDEARRRRGTTASELWRHVAVHPEPGLRLHLHRRDDPRPVEIDPQVFEFGRDAAPAGGALAALARWIDAVAAGAPFDDGFRHVTPALAPAQPETHSAAAALDALRDARARARASPVMLDNLAQFRFYSAWRATVERHVGSRAD